MLTGTAPASGPVPAPVRKLRPVSADGTVLYAEVYGPEGAPAVVLSHGWTCSTLFWSHQLRVLAGDHRVVVYDQRGHGRSRTVGPAGCTTDALADDLEAVLAATLEPDEKAVLVGHSMGGMTLMAAAGRPGLRRHAAAALLCSTGSSRLVAESLLLPLRAGRLRDLLTTVILGARAPLGPVTPVSRALLKYGTMGPGAAPDRVAECARIVHACPRPIRVAWAHVLEELEIGHTVRELRVPTAIVAGAADRLTPPVHAHALAAELPECLGVEVLPGVGHMSPVEAPEAVTARIRALAETYLPGLPGQPRTAGAAKTGPASTTEPPGAPEPPDAAVPTSTTEPTRTTEEVV
ncbi:alpha/beta fold hydrolase [Streptomyces pyxinae]|uniref:alpha/beta fold hydrolase n=1 Tax=Streptomyces pyxinae TaxID=2970734 RepID=UPI003D17DBA2